MKIGILTQPLGCNYGGLLQNYALQQVLIQSGHDVITLDRRSPCQKPRSNMYLAIRKKMSMAYRRISSIIRKNKIDEPLWLLPEEQKIIERDIEYFKDKHIIRTKPIYSTEELYKTAIKNDVQAYIVGSDQVWRAEYSPRIENYFVDFDQRPDIKKIGYAISFGTDKWDLNEEQTRTAKRLAKQFTAISVREYDGIKICRDNLNITVVQMPDPTLLLDRNHYIDLLHKEKEPEEDVGLLTYILDYDDTKKHIISTSAAMLGLSVSRNMPKKIDEHTSSDIASYIYPSVTQWICKFKNAKFVITDSFHGCVFSIIFNKPFIAIINKSRGASRFVSLLSTFGLQNRMVEDPNTPFLELLHTPIDWSDVNRISERKRKEALLFLSSNL